MGTPNAYTRELKEAYSRYYAKIQTLGDSDAQGLEYSDEQLRLWNEAEDEFISIYRKYHNGSHSH